MITAENDYEPIIYEQPFTSHLYENQLELLHNYDTTSNSNKVPVEQEVIRIKTVIKPEKYKAQIRTKYIKIYKKNNQEKKFGQFHFS